VYQSLRSSNVKIQLPSFPFGCYINPYFLYFGVRGGADGGAREKWLYISYTSRKNSGFVEFQFLRDKAEGPPVRHMQRGKQFPYFLKNGFRELSRWRFGEALGEFLAKLN
jgi:hypothetical protein